MRIILNLMVISASITLFGQAYNEDLKENQVEILIDKNNLLLPMGVGQDYKIINIKDAKTGELLRKYQGLLTVEKPDWMMELDVSALKDKSVILEVENQNLKGMRYLLSDGRTQIDNNMLFARSGYHFTPKYGWQGVPNGLVYFKDTWHMIFEYKPMSLENKGSRFFGHAKSKNLVDWTYMPNVRNPSISAISGKLDSPMAGTLYCDSENKSGFFKTKGGGVILAYTSSARGDCFAISSDMVRFKDLDFKPDYTAKGDSPKLFFNKDSNLWTIIRREYQQSGNEEKSYFAIYVSQDLRKWQITDKIEGFLDKPEMFKAYVVGSQSQYKWVISQADGRYIVGDFDGRKFKADKYGMRQLFLGEFYAMQVWDNASDNRVLATAKIVQPTEDLINAGITFSQAMSIPIELTLAKLSDGQIQLRANPAEEINDILGFAENALGIPSMTFKSNTFVLPNATGNRQLITMVCDLRNTNSYGIEVGNIASRYLINKGIFTLFRNGKTIGAYAAQLPNTTNQSATKTFMDEACATIFYGNGDSIMFLGGPFLNNLVEFKLSSEGTISTNNVRKQRVGQSLEDKGKQAQKVLDYLLKNTNN